MKSELDWLITTEYRQSELLREAALRRLTRTDSLPREEPLPSGRRLRTLLRRIAGAPTFA